MHYAVMLSECALSFLQLLSVSIISKCFAHTQYRSIINITCNYLTAPLLDLFFFLLAVFLVRLIQQRVVCNPLEKNPVLSDGHISVLILATDKLKGIISRHC